MGMSNGFLNTFQQYSNVELLKIVKRPADYQPEAINAAAEILTSRNVSEQELNEVEFFYYNIDLKEQEKQEKLNAINDKVTDFLEPLLQPKTETNPGKWLNVFLLFIAIQYLWYIFKTVERFIDFYKNHYLFDFTYAGDVLTLFYVPLVFYLLYKRKKWGWILLFADAAFSGSSLLSESWILFKYQDIHHGNVSTFLWSVFAEVALVIFLWRPEIADWFGIDEKEKKKFVIRIAAVVAALFAGMFGALALMK